MGASAVGGGAFSGKDPTKVDRSASYMARYIALDVVNKFKVHKCLVQLSYAIGVSEPVSIIVDTYGCGKEDEIIKYINETYDLTPKGIIEFLNLLNIKYVECAKYGHMSKDYFNWNSIK